MDDFLNIIKGYQDILVKIDQHTVLKESAEHDKKYYGKQMTASFPGDISAMAMDGQPHGNFSPVTLDRAYEELNKCDIKIELEESNINRLLREKKAIENSINKLSGLEYKVAFKRVFEKNKDGSCKTLQQIANELFCSLSTVEHASARISKTLNVPEIRKKEESI